MSANDPKRTSVRFTVLDCPPHAAAEIHYTSRLVKGAAVSDLPFEEPTEIRLAANLRTARSLGITIPPTILARADEVIE